MELWAAIDLLGGSVVTLRQGREADRTSWKEGPLDLAKRWEDEGADGLHIVDLDAAFGKGSNRKTVLSIVEASKIPVEVGGGVRSVEVAEELLDGGASRVILGTIAYADPEALLGLIRSRGGSRFVVAADYSEGGEVVVRGWTAGMGLTVFQAARRMERTGVETLLVTAVGRDGMAEGPDVATIGRLCPEVKMKVLASGGIRDSGDLQRLAEAGASGAVIGRALYDGGVRLRDARARLAR